MKDSLQKKFFYPLAESYLRENSRFLSQDIMYFDYLENEQIMKYTFSKVKNLLQHSIKTTTYYKHLSDRYGFQINQIENIQDFSKFPILTKNILRDQFTNLISSVKFPKVSKIHSGGTMGQSIYVLKDNYSLSYDRAVKGKCIGWYNCQIGDKEFRFWAYPFGKKDMLKSYCIDLLLNRRRVSPIHLTKDSVNNIIDIIHNFRPKLIYGWTSGLFKFAQIVQENGLQFLPSNLKLVISTAEMLYDKQRNVISEVFRAPVVDEYGCSEAGVIGFECEAGNKHIQVENNYLEVINQEQYENGVGELVCTSLNNYAMPLIRYKIGDIGKIEYGSCKCGRRSPIVSKVSGRILDYLIDSDGDIVLGEVFCYICFDLIDNYNAIKDFRVRQDIDRTLNIYFVPTPEFFSNFLIIFEKAIRKRLGHSINIYFHKMEDLSSMDQGKPRYVVSYSESVVSR